MATIDYKEKYEQAMERARQFFEKPYLEDSAGIVGYIFPELKESEDERIRKHLIGVVELYYGNTDEQEKKDCLAWLEKQSTPQVRTGLEWVNTIDDACDKRYSEEYAHGEYCHEQSFKWGFQEGVDWLEKQGKQKHKIVKGKNYFCVKTHNYAGVEWVKGTKYYASDNYTLVNQGCECYCPEYSKEEHNNLFEEVKYDGCVEKQNEQKSAEWSADDLPEFESYLCLMFQKFRTKGVCTNGEIVDFVKEHSQKLKDTLCHPWSKDDEDYFDAIIAKLEVTQEDAALTDNQMNFLKSLKDRVQPQSQWKPSEEQMDALRYVTNFDYGGHKATLVSLYEQLKKL